MKLGIWIDKRIAKIFSAEGNGKLLCTVESNIDEFNPQGGSGSKIKGGPQDVVQDSKYLKREKHQLKEFFKNIISKLNDADSIVLFGPAETKQKLEKEIKNSHLHLSQKIKGIESADSMTNNQLTSWVVNYFS